MAVYTFHRGHLPLLISVPHAGTQVPEHISKRFTPRGRELVDTDWYVDRLYRFAAAMGASMISADYSRYVVDLNRSPDSASLYASNPTSPVCATLTFGGEPIYEPGAEPDADEVSARVEQYWQPYHQCIAEELWRIRSRHGYAVLWDAHSIASRVSGLFEGELPEFNFGTRDHAACPAEICSALLQSILSGPNRSAVLNGRFKGGYITMNYGQPDSKVWAVQLELAQRTYMVESPRGEWDPARAQAVAIRIEGLLGQLLQLAELKHRT